MDNVIRLVGDLGGTNARFALVAQDCGYHSERVFRCSDFTGVEQAIRAYLDAVGCASPDVISLATAGHVHNGQCRFTNNHWVVSEAVLSSVFSAGQVTLLNDFVAVAYGLPALHQTHCLMIGHILSNPDMSGDLCLGVMGPGTGLGVGGLMRHGEHHFPMTSEAGHMAFAPETTLQQELLGCLARRFDRVSDERLLSGPGIENIFQALAEVHGKLVEQKSAADIFSYSQRHGYSIERQTTDVFFEVLGQVAGDLALAFGVEQGMYIAGGIAQRYPEMLLSSGFRSGFVNKGRHQALLERVPTLLVEHPYPGLYGAAEFVRLNTL